MSEYYIPNHVHFVIAGDVAVFLDLRADQYRMLVGAKARVFKSILTTTASTPQRIIVNDCRDTDNRCSVVADLIKELLANKLITTAIPPATSPPPTDIPTPDSSFLESQDSAATGVDVRDVVRFFSSCLIAKFRLKFSSIESIVGSVDKRRRAQNPRAQLDLGKARRLVYIYYRLRPLLPQSYLCLFDSITLLTFLSKYDCFPSWVFAVRLEPWEAHCWVQYETVAFNEYTDRARAYLPLMVV
ncbi:MAG TPA: lasso peptide biosynthesis B2 protein [Steroidobacteraceae bacterium]|nr:lasso peptide biosynthesis B2 protein [Steroidobacteraceae bacterium]